jgi:hypothetical protein
LQEDRPISRANSTEGYFTDGYSCEGEAGGAVDAAVQRLDVRREGFPTAEVHARTGEEVDERAIHAESGNVAVVSGAGVKYAADPTVEVINELAVTAIRTK